MGKHSAEEKCWAVEHWCESGIYGIYSSEVAALAKMSDLNKRSALDHYIVEEYVLDED